MIDPAFFTSETIATLPVATRLTWIGIWTYADDHGHAKDNASLVKAAVWPLDDAYTAKKVGLDLDRLVDNGSLCRFECCGQKQLHIPTWLLWQKVSHPTETKLCPCPGHEPDAAQIHARDSRLPPAALTNPSGAILPSVVKDREEEVSSRAAAECAHDSAPELCPICRRQQRAAS